ncbi:MAG: sugar ABC transporter ATP-binding protein [Spirochaetia bacterium]|jgi:simple sugar transport system ATP-binding protein
MGNIFLSLHNVSKSFSGVQALSHVDLGVREGEVHCLMGENGSGKSTLIKIIAGVVPPDAGSEIRIRNKVYRRVTAFEALSEGIQVIYQDLSLFPNLSVMENIAMSFFIHERRPVVNRHEMTSIACEAMGKISVTLDPATLVQDLSIANQQLVAICRSITRGGRLIIMDEPTSSLGRKDIDYLFSVIKSLREQGIAILFVGHKLNEVFEIADRVTVIRDGVGVGSYEIGELDHAKLIQLMTGRTVTVGQLAERREDAAAVLEVKNLTKKGQFDNVSFRLAKGEILGLIGLVGAGRTEVALSIFGLNRADSGEILVDGVRRKIRTVQNAIKNGIGYVPENRLVQGLFMDHSVKRNLMATVLRMLLGRLGLFDMKRIAEFVRTWIAKLGIKTPTSEALVKQLSGGNQQRVVLSKWLERSPKILLLDTPTVGIDVGAKEEIHTLIKNLAAEGMGILLISDEVAEIIQHTHRFLLMRGGRIVDEHLSSSITDDGLLKQLLER